MHGRVSAVVLSIFVSGFMTIAACGAACAEGAVDALVAVAGNRHTDAAMIRSNFHVAPNSRLDAATINAALKSLYATGLFADVKIVRDGDRVVVQVVENPTIQQIAFDLGYGTASSFIVMFRRAAGTTPEQYRAQRAAPSSNHLRAARKG